MKKTILFAYPDNTILAHALANELSVEMGEMMLREFPDGESYVRIDSDVKDKTALLICSLDHPNSKLLPLLFMARTIKELGAKNVVLISPYLPYMRQDKRFHSGEAITSILFAELMSTWLDCLITIDPHLHRIQTLSDIYTIPDIVTLHATSIIADWIVHHVESPVLIGPDEESRQWVAEIAGFANAPFVIGEKKRMGDAQVILSLPDIKNTEHTPILVDDIISSGASMLEAINQLRSRGHKKPICIGVHALFNTETEHKLLLAGAEKMITCNTIQHTTNQIDITSLIAKSIVESC